MARGSVVQVEIRGQVRALEALAAVNKEAQFAQRTALRAAGSRARTLVVRQLSRAVGVPQKLYRSRVLFFFQRTRQGLSAGRLWLGLKWGIRYSDHPAARARLPARWPLGFALTVRGGRTGWFERTPSGGLVERTLDVEDEARREMESGASEAMRERYVQRLRQDYLRRLARRRERGRRR